LAVTATVEAFPWDPDEWRNGAAEIAAFNSLAEADRREGVGVVGLIDLEFDAIAGQWRGRTLALLIGDYRRFQADWSSGCRLLHRRRDRQFRPR
jgi:hypothetical protein